MIHKCGNNIVRIFDKQTSFAKSINNPLNSRLKLATNKII